MAKKLNDNQKNQIILASVLLVIGVCFCFSISLATEIISIIIGIGFIVSGLGLLVSSLCLRKSIITIPALAGLLIIAFGIYFIKDQLAGVLLAFVPWILITFGAGIVIDSVLLISYRDKNNKKGFILEIVVGIIVIVLGLLLVFIPEFAKFAGIILGVSLIAYAIYSLTTLKQVK